MGQYYRPVLKQNGKVTVYNRNVDGEYTVAKLMKHSWWNNDLLRAIGAKLYKKRGQLAWVGDYVDDEDLVKMNMTFEDVWGSEHKQVRGHGLKSVKFIFDNKYLCNHTKEQYINLKEYYELAVEDGWCINPLSLLCAIGNGLGGGDFYSDTCIYKDDIGTWAWDEISIEDTAPADYSRRDTIFKE